VGILDGAGKVWGVRIPDVPGCHGGGPTPEAAVADAISALREVGDCYVARGVALPAPRGMADIIRDEEAEYDPARESLVMVPLLFDRGRPVKADISLDAGLLEAIDEEAARRGLTRSAFLVSAAIDKIENAGVQGYRERGSVSADLSGAQAPLSSGFAEPAAPRLKPRSKSKTRRR
jgi:predicted RNase H-like HicB family nuclease